MCNGWSTACLRKHESRQEERIDFAAGNSVRAAVQAPVLWRVCWQAVEACMGMAPGGTPFCSLEQGLQTCLLALREEL